MESFIEECRSSPMSDKDKARLEAQLHSYLGEQASWDREYVSASEHYLTAYQIEKAAKGLYRSGESAKDGGVKELPLSRLSQLIERHTKNELRHTQRGDVNESNY